MEKKVVFFLIPIILGICLSLVLAQNESSHTNESSITSNFSEIKGRTNEFLSRELTLPQEEVIRIIFGLNLEEELRTDKIIIFFCVFLSILFVIQGILVIAPFFEGPKSWVGALIVTLIMGSSGIMISFTNALFSLTNPFRILNEWSPIKVAFIILILFFIFYVLKKVSRILNEMVRIDNAESEGILAGIGIKMLKIVANTNRKKNSGGGSDQDPKKDINLEISKQKEDSIKRTDSREFKYQKGMRRGGEKSTKNRFVKEESAERYAKTYGQEAAKKRFRED